jgi:hypothetical protein
MLAEDVDEPKSDLLTEPDLPEDDGEQEEQSVVANVAGATTPLGTDATYPNSRVGHRKSAAEAASGGVRLPKKKKIAETVHFDMINRKKVKDLLSHALDLFWSAETANTSYASGAKEVVEYIESKLDSIN